MPEKIEFFFRRMKYLRMSCQILGKPGGSRFLGSDSNKELTPFQDALVGRFFITNFGQLTDAPPIFMYGPQSAKFWTTEGLNNFLLSKTPTFNSLPIIPKERVSHTLTPRDFAFFPDSIIPTEFDIDPFDGGKSVHSTRRGAQRDTGVSGKRRNKVEVPICPTCQCPYVWKTTTKAGLFCPIKFRWC